MSQKKDDSVAVDTYNISPLYHGEIVIIARHEWNVLVNSLRACGIIVNENNVNICLPIQDQDAKIPG